MKEGWLLLVPLLAVYVLLGTIERQLNGYLVFHYHQYICSSISDLLWFLSVSMAVLLTFGDKLTMPWRLLRFLLICAFLFLLNSIQIALNAWPFLDAGKWAIIFGVILMLFMVGNSIVRALLRWAAGPARFRWWYAGFCLFIGVVPLLVLLIMETQTNRATQLQSSMERFRMAVVLTSAICLPYAVSSVFVLLGIRSSLYRDRLANVFGVKDLAGPKQEVKQVEEEIVVTGVKG